ncbi:DNA-binding protein [Maritimibacter sp. DP07]|uniref:DNA-binding protein n=1 Tax=Maritimibacter harenae TaxID=2606218 RepID=A0A845M6Q9_9RHOB|nr:OB-fold domain-containing protein [Maritimibacter harenae]MZR13417.1 DNA-binding protein [Maritimibacter harenae]
MKAIFEHVGEVFACGDVAFQHCTSCGSNQAFARPFCVVCQADTLDWRTATTGRVAAVTIMHRAPTPEWKSRLPYAIALIDLDDGPRIMSGCETELRVGDRVCLLPDGQYGLPYFMKER